MSLIFTIHFSKSTATFFNRACARPAFQNWNEDWSIRLFFFKRPRHTIAYDTYVNVGHWIGLEIQDATEQKQLLELGTFGSKGLYLWLGQGEKCSFCWRKVNKFLKSLIRRELNRKDLFIVVVYAGDILLVLLLRSKYRYLYHHISNQSKYR